MSNTVEGTKKPRKPRAKKVVPPQTEPRFTATVRIPTADQYAYIEVQATGTREEIHGVYQEFMTMVRGGNGLEPKEFNAILDEYLVTNKIAGDPGMVSAMNIDQSSIIQAIKRSRARTNK